MSVRTIALSAAALAATAAVGAATAAPAAADDYYRGRVTAVGGVVARAWPTTASTNYGVYDQGEIISIACKIRGSVVDGNDLWYLVPAEGYEWVTARYVANVGATPRYCTGDGNRDVRTTATLTKRVAPTTAAASAGTVAKGTRISVVCKLDGQSVGGNTRWYYTQDGRWISARYATNVTSAPDFCH